MKELIVLDQMSEEIKIKLVLGVIFACMTLWLQEMDRADNMSQFLQNWEKCLRRLNENGGVVRFLQEISEEDRERLMKLMLQRDTSCS